MGARRWGPKFRAFFSLSRPQFRSFCLSLGVFSWNFRGVFEAPGPSDVHVWSSRVVVGFHTSTAKAAATKQKQQQKQQQSRKTTKTTTKKQKQQQSSKSSSKSSSKEAKAAAKAAAEQQKAPKNNGKESKVAAK